MALQWQNTELPFGRGIDTKTDPKLVVPPFLTTLENGSFNNGGSIIKRQGYKSLPTLSNAGNITNGLGLASYNDGLLLFDGTNAYSYSVSTSSWTLLGALTSLMPETSPIASTPFKYQCQHSAVTNNTRCTVYLDAAGNLRLTLQDTQTGTVYLLDGLYQVGTYIRPKVVPAVNGQYFFIFYGTSATTLMVARIATANPTNILTPIMVVSDMFGGIYDVAYLNNRLTLAYSYDNGANNSGIKIIQVTDIGTIGSKNNNHADPLTYSLGTTGHAPSVINVAPGSGNVSTTFYVSMYNGLLRAIHYIPGGISTPLATDPEGNTVAMGGSPSNPVHNITAVQVDDPQDLGQVSFFYDTADGHVGLYSYDSALKYAGAYSGNIITYNMCLASQAFEYLGATYVSVYYDSPIQPTYFVYSNASSVVGKHSAQIASYAFTGTNASTLPPVTETTPGIFEFAKTERGNLTSDASGNVSFPSAVILSVFNFNRSTRYATALLNYNLYIGAGFVYIYDGANLVEDGFALAPELPVDTPSSTGGFLTDGSRFYKACWTWTDAQGQTHRSATSVPLNVTLAGGTSTQSVALTFESLAATLKANTTIEIYRTIANGTVHFCIASLPAPLNANPINFTDTLSDNSIATFPTLYTDGGELDNDAPVSMRHVFSSRNRLFGIASESPYSLWYTKEAVKGVGVGWSNALVRQVPPLGGECQVVAAIDDNIIVFKENKFFGFQGEGPDPTGAQDDFTPFSLINTDVGCDNGPSIVFTSEGLMFQSKKGIRLLSRTLQIMDVGAPVQAFNSTLVTSAQLLSDVNQVRFTTLAGPTLVYDYYWKAADPSGQLSIGQWSTFTNQTGADSAVWNDVYVYLRPDGTVLQETPGYYLDDDIFYSLKVETANIAVTGAQSLFRCRRAYLLGTYSSPHQLIIGIAYNYGDVTQQQIWRTDQAIAITTWGSDAVFGSEAQWGGPNDAVYQFRINPSRQRVQAIRFRFEDQPLGTDTPGAAYSLTGLALEVGGKKGLFKLGTAKTARS